MSDRFADWVTIVPGKGEAGATAKKLLSIATSRSQVRTAEGGAVFVVAPEVAAAYNRPQEDKPAPRKRAPRKPKEGDE
jgi:hypothetical protein